MGTVREISKRLHVIFKHMKLVEIFQGVLLKNRVHREAKEGAGEKKEECPGLK